MRPPFLITVFLRQAAHRIFKLGNKHPPIDWGETVSDTLARLVVGLVVGGGICILLWPALYWPGLRSGRSLIEQLGMSGQGRWIFGVTLIGAALVGALSTRVKTWGQSWVPLPSEEQVASRAKTGCMGILLPVGLAIYGVYYITHPRKLNRFGRLHEPEFVVGLGMLALGMALCVHAFGFGPYERFPLLKWLAAAAGVGLCILGLTWSQSG